MILASDLQAVEVALAVAHDLVRPVAFLVRMGGLPVTGMHILRLEAHGPAEGEVGLKDFLRVADRTLVTHEALRGRRSRAEAAIEVRVFRREYTDGARVKAARPVVVQDVPKRLKPPPGGAKGTVIGVGPVHDPVCEFRVVQLVGDVVRQQAADHEGLGGKRELARPRGRSMA